MRIPFRLSLALVLVLTVLGATARVSVQSNAQYQVVDLGVVAPFTSSGASGVNELGDVVGTLSTPGVAPKLGGFLSINGQMIALSGMRSAHAINARRVVVGQGDFGGGLHAAKFLNGSAMDLGTLPGGGTSSANAINSLDQIVGTSDSPNGSRAVLFANGSVLEVQASVGEVIQPAAASAMNDRSQIAGIGRMPGRQNFRGFFLTGGIPVDLGSFAWGTLLTNGFTQPNDVNDLGDVVGHSEQWIGNGWAPRAFLATRGRLIDLGTLGRSGGSHHSTAAGINNSGQIVGTTTVAGSGTAIIHAFIYSSGVMTDLNAIASVPSGWYLSSASAINDSGYIAATMANPQTYTGRACLLIPTTPAAPAITTSPLDQTVTTGSSVSLLAIAKGNPIPSYQWQTSTDGTTWSSLAEGAPYSGTTSPVLTIGSADVSLSGRKYRLQATNTSGTAMSSAATLAVQSSAVAPTIMTGPASANAAVGGSVAFSVQTVGTEPLTYEWRRNGVAITGLNQPQLLISNVQRAHAGSYTVKVTNAAGSATSAAATLSALGASPMDLLFGGLKSGATLAAATPAQMITVTYAGSGAPAWTVTADQPWIDVIGASGSGNGAFSIGIKNPNDVIGTRTTLSAIVSVVSASLGVRADINVTLNVQQGAAGAAPFGAFDTPANNATGLQGSIAVTGWALDDIGIDRVEIWRDRVAGETTPVFSGAGPGNGKIFIGNAFFVSGARPDVQGFFPSYPLSQRAGWGYLLLTWGLWQQGNGTYTLYAFGFDVEGGTTTLGSKTITVANANANKPFGAIDTPAYGGSASGATWNYGWALTPGTCTVKGGSVQVSVDSGPLVPVTYGDRRDDVAAVFPTFTDAPAAGGHYRLDTSALPDGIHQIGWLVTDSCGRSDGIGSRFFTVTNGGTSTQTAAPSPFIATRVAERLQFLRNGQPYTAQRAADGEWIVPLPQGARFELRLPDESTAYEGTMLSGEPRGALPLGSSFDRENARFYWEPAPGFLGAYDFVFAAPHRTVRVRAVVGPPARMVVDIPAAGNVLAREFEVRGWAIDLASPGAGVDAVHVWGYPVGGGSPAFAGNTSMTGDRPDVAALFGQPFGRSGFGGTVNLPPGTYDLVIFAHLVRDNSFVASQPVRVVVR